MWLSKILEKIGVKYDSSNYSKTKINVGLGDKQYQFSNESKMGTSGKNKSRSRNTRKSAIGYPIYHSSPNPALLPAYLRDSSSIKI
jgi:hypothetical protein